MYGRNLHILRTKAARFIRSSALNFSRDSGENDNNSGLVIWLASWLQDTPRIDAYQKVMHRKRVSPEEICLVVASTG